MGVRSLGGPTPWSFAGPTELLAFAVWDGSHGHTDQRLRPRALSELSEASRYPGRAPSLHWLWRSPGRGWGFRRGGAAVASRDALVLNELVRRLNRLRMDTRGAAGCGISRWGLIRRRAFLGARQQGHGEAAQATERLGRARVISFATHGLLSADISGLTESRVGPESRRTTRSRGPPAAVERHLELRLTNTSG